MKRLFSILILFLLTSTTQAQWLPFDFFNKKTDTYNVRATEFFARVTTAGETLTASQKTVYNTIFQQLQDSGLIGTTRAGDSLAVLYAFATCISGNETIAKLNLLDTRYSCTNVNSVVFTDSGASFGGNKRLLTNFNAVLDSSIFKQSSASYMMYCVKNVDEVSRDMGVVPSGFIYGAYIIIRSGDMIYSRMNSIGSSTPNTNAIGVYVMARNLYNYGYIMKNGTVLTTTTDANVSLVNDVVPIGCQYSGGLPGYYSTKTFSFVAIMSGLSTDKARKLSNILNEALRPFGYNVY